MDFGTLGARAAAALRTTANSIEAHAYAGSSSWVVEFNALATDNPPISSKLRELFGSGPAIYMLQTVQVDCSALLRAFEAQRLANFRYARLNPHHSETCVYVGSSASVAGRLKEQLTRGPAGRYALHLNTWAGSLHGALRVTVMPCRELAPDLMGILEDHLWDELKPIFGRRGRR